MAKRMCASYVTQFAAPLQGAGAVVKAFSTRFRTGRMGALARVRPEYRGIVAGHRVKVNSACLCAMVMLLLAAQSCAPSVPIVRQKVEHFSAHDEDFTYLLYVPDEFNGAGPAKTRWPLILYLHGILETGDNIELLTRRGMPKRLELGLTLPFFVISPQNPDTFWDVSALQALLDQVIEKYPVNADRIYVTGVSLGGVATWELAARAPDRFAAIAPVSGWGDVATAARVKDLPIWAQHGKHDFLVWPSAHEKMIEAVRQAGGSPRWTTVSGGHDVWDAVYGNAELYRWFLRHERKPTSHDAG